MPALKDSISLSSYSSFIIGCQSASQTSNGKARQKGVKWVTQSSTVSHRPFFGFRTTKELVELLEVTASSMALSHFPQAFVPLARWGVIAKIKYGEDLDFGLRQTGALILALPLSCGTWAALGVL